MQSKRRPSYHEYDSAPPPVSGPHVALTQMYNAPGAVYVNSTLKSNAGHGGHPSSSMQHAPMAPPMGAPARRTTDTAASYGQGTGYASVQYAPPPVRQSQPMYPPPPPLDISGPIGPHGAATRAAAVNYDSDVSSMATPVATPDASFRYRTSAFSPNEASESPPPAPISYLGSSGRDSAHDRVPTLLRPQSFLALPIMGGEMDLAPNSGSMRLPPSTGYAPPQAYGPPPLMNGPPARVRATSGSSIAPNGRMEMPPPPIGPGMSSNHSNIGQYSQANAAAAMQNVYSRSIQQQQYADPGSPGSRGKGSGHGAPNYIGGYPNNNMPVVGPPAGVPGSPTGKSLNNNRNRIDPSQLPRPPPPPKDFVYHTRAGLGRKVPPVSNAVFQCVDTGNCSPRFLRVTTGAPSTTSALAYKLGVPLALVCDLCKDVLYIFLFPNDLV